MAPRLGIERLIGNAILPRHPHPRTQGSGATQAQDMSWSRESRHARGYGTAWDKLRKRILARDCHLCQPCKRAGRIKAGNQVDHRTPKAKGGTDDEDNLEVICEPCHRDKSAAESGRPLKQKQRIALDGWPAED